MRLPACLACQGQQQRTGRSGAAPSPACAHLDEADCKGVWLDLANELFADGPDELVGGTEDEDVGICNLQGCKGGTDKSSHTGGCQDKAVRVVAPSGTDRWGWGSTQ